MSSLIMIGPQGSSICCFNARSGKTDEGHFQIDIGPEQFVLVKSLHAANPTTEPANKLDNFGGSAEFGDSLSSFRFGPCP